MTRQRAKPERDGLSPRPDREAERLLENAFPASSQPARGAGSGQLFAVIPEAIIQASPEEFAAFLDTVLADDGEVDQALDDGLTPVSGGEPSGHRTVRAVVPAELLRSRDADPDRFLSQVFAAFDEIDQVLVTLEDRRGTGPSGGREPTMAVVPEEVISDPEALMQAIDRVQSDALRLELLLRQARHTLRRLHVYRLSRRRPGQLVGEMRKADHVRTLQYLVEFLRSIQLAADSFEALELPRPHIRDYLEYLYSIEDWNQMAELVGTLRRAVFKFLQAESGG